MNHYTPQELEQSLARTLQTWDPRSPLWIFAYGSLIWNPEIEYDHRQLAIIHGYHRRLCLWSRLYRGTPEHPGLVLGLDHGGSCQGVLYRIAPDSVPHELMKLWQRELSTKAYIPRWLHARRLGKAENSLIAALAFVIDRSGNNYAGKLDQATILATLRSAHGQRGTNRDYLQATVQSLDQHGIRDLHLTTLAKQL